MGKRREFVEKGKKGTQLCEDVREIEGNIGEIGKICGKERDRKRREVERKGKQMYF